MLTPAVFISHGSPLTVLTEDDYAEALRAFGRSLARPRGVVVMSAHGPSRPGTTTVTSAERPPLVYDFAGFPPELYDFRYPCPGSPGLAEELASALRPLGLEVTLDGEGGLDHGVWVPLARLFPAGDVPVVQLSMPFPGEEPRLLDIGRALAPLRDTGVLLVGSGGAVHNLRALDWHAHGSKAASPWAREFADWLGARVRRLATDELLRWAAEAPHARLAHPSPPDHLDPIFFTLGAARPGERARTIIDEFQYETLSMYSFAIGG
jgi:4,5-DOPA dioxygenase extradiol